jgi:hypothetical protein
MDYPYQLYCKRLNRYGENRFRFDGVMFDTMEAAEERLLKIVENGKDSKNKGYIYQIRLNRKVLKQIGI